MNPNPQNRNIKALQLVTTIVLVLILGAMVAGYIYYGMYAARNIEIIVETENPTLTPGMDEAKRQEIITALGQEANTLSDEKKDEIIDSLTAEQQNQQLSPEAEAKRQETINALQQN